jgi:arylsulfatase A-like enzyme
MARVASIVVFCLVIAFVAWAVIRQRFSGPRNASSPPAEQRRIANPPNFVILLGEHIGYGDLGCYGQKHIATPHLDRLAAEGIRLTEFYAGDPTGEATCWCLMTGRDMAAGGSGSTRFVLRPQQATVAEVLRRAGYDTGFVGPWGLGGDDQANTPGTNGFTEWAVMAGAADPSSEHPESFVRNGDRVPVTSNSDGKQGQHVSDLILQEAVSFLQRHKTGNPFLLFVVCPGLWSAAASPPVRDQAETDGSESRQAYAARVADFDRVAGVVMDELQGLGLANRTALLVTSSSGPGTESEGDVQFFRSTGGLRGNPGELYEGNLRVPLIARLPGQAFKGVDRDYPGVCWDLLPTLAELSGAVGVPKQKDGVSIASILRGGIGPQRDMLYWETRRNGLGQAVRMGDWKVVRPPGKTQRENCELYHLKKDPHEKRNVAKQHPEIVTKFLK